MEYFLHQKQKQDEFCRIPILQFDLASIINEDFLYYFVHFCYNPVGPDKAKRKHLRNIKIYYCLQKIIPIANRFPSKASNVIAVEVDSKSGQSP